MDQIVAIRKPVGPTSHDVIDDIRHITGQRTVGHAGTLDPLASGVLVVGVGRQATRRLGEVTGQEKEYLTTIRLGAESTTDDRQGDKTNFKVSKKPLPAGIRRVIQKFIGSIKQAPPAFSA